MVRPLEFRGRVGRVIFCLYISVHGLLCSVVYNVTITHLDTLAEQSTSHVVSIAAASILTMAASALIFILPVVFRRLHDIGLSGAWAWLLLTPFSPFLLLLLASRSGARGENRFGNPARSAVSQLRKLVDAAQGVLGVGKPASAEQRRTIAARYLIGGLTLVLFKWVNDNEVYIHELLDGSGGLVIGLTLMLWGAYGWLTAPYSNSKPRAGAEGATHYNDPPTKAREELASQRRGGWKSDVSVAASLLFTLLLLDPTNSTYQGARLAYASPTIAAGALAGGGAGAAIFGAVGAITTLPAGGAGAAPSAKLGTLIGGNIGAVVASFVDSFQMQHSGAYVEINFPNTPWDFLPYHITRIENTDPREIAGVVTVIGFSRVVLDSASASLLAGGIIPYQEDYVTMVSSSMGVALLSEHPIFLRRASCSLREGVRSFLQGKDCAAPEEAVPQQEAQAEPVQAPPAVPASQLQPGTASVFRDCPADEGRLDYLFLSRCPEMIRIPGQNFEAGRFEVTFEEWDACVADGGCDGYRPNDEGWGRGRRPVINVSWNDAQAYVQWLNQRSGRRYRLLTSAEWEIAARAGTTTDYSWGDDPPVCDQSARNGANFRDCAGNGSHPVGSFRPNGFGLYDVHGNVWEWVQDAEGSSRVLRGGSWLSLPQVLRSAARSRFDPSYRDNLSFGFRLARTL